MTILRVIRIIFFIVLFLIPLATFLLPFVVLGFIVGVMVAPFTYGFDKAPEIVTMVLERSKSWAIGKGKIVKEKELYEGRVDAQVS